jgi:uncharacterized protein YecT (DUF1311 family)
MFNSRFILLTVFFLFSAAFHPAPAQARDSMGFCDQADSTAAVQACLKRHLTNAQKRLNKIYNQLSAKLETEKKAELQELQQNWLAYRDAECMWESENSVTPSTKRLNELSCMTRLTEDRADILSVAYSDSEDINQRRQYGSFPRWMNALAKDYPEILWDYGTRTSMDLNCDEEEEALMIGVITENIEHLQSEKATDSPEKTEATPQPRHYSKEMILAVVENPPIGRPDPLILRFPVQTPEDDESICDDSLSLKLNRASPKRKSLKEGEAAPEEPQEKSCDASLMVSARGCQPKTVVWTGKTYGLAVEETPESAENKEK